jgi:hypothetical protein
MPILSWRYGALLPLQAAQWHLLPPQQMAEMLGWEAAQQAAHFAAHKRHKMRHSRIRKYSVLYGALSHKSL